MVAQHHLDLRIRAMLGHQRLQKLDALATLMTSPHGPVGFRRGHSASHPRQETQLLLEPTGRNRPEIARVGRVPRHQQGSVNQNRAAYVGGGADLLLASQMTRPGQGIECPRKLTQYNRALAYTGGF